MSVGLVLLSICQSFKFEADSVFIHWTWSNCSNFLTLSKPRFYHIASVCLGDSVSPQAHKRVHTHCLSVIWFVCIILTWYVSNIDSRCQFMFFFVVILVAIVITLHPIPFGSWLTCVSDCHWILFCLAFLFKTILQHFIDELSMDLNRRVHVDAYQYLFVGLNLGMCACAFFPTLSDKVLAYRFLFSVFKQFQVPLWIVAKRNKKNTVNLK